MSNSSICQICSIDKTLLGAATPSQSGPVSNDNKGVHHILQRSTAGALPSDVLELNPEHFLVGIVLLLSRDAVGVFYSASRLGWILSGTTTPDQSGYFTYLRFLELEPYYQIQFSVIPRTCLFFLAGFTTDVVKGHKQDSYFYEGTSPFARETVSQFSVLLTGWSYFWYRVSML